MTGGAGRSAGAGGQARPRRRATAAARHARLWGMADGYTDALGRWQPTPEATRTAVLAAMGADPDAPPAPAPVRVVRRGRGARLPGPAELILEDGGRRRVADHLPSDVPTGYHELRPDDDGAPVLLVVAPARCHLPPALRAWGWAAQLYAARSEASWGIGDLGDLRRLAGWSAEALGAGMLLVNPLHADTPVPPLEASPYFPSSRRYRNLLYLRVEDVPGAPALGPALEPLAAAGRALNRERRIDRDAVFALKREALDRLWARFAGDPAFDRYLEGQGPALTAFATFCALAERHGRGWRAWPAAYRRPDHPEVARFAAETAARVRFFAWGQWLLDQQLAAAVGRLAVMQDLPIGVDPDGADAWAWQDVLAAGVSVGAPPDEFNTRGQDWGLPPFIPHRLRAVRYGPFIETIRATLRHAGGLRIDHVMGLFRLFWIPRGAGPAAGCYVHYAADEILGIVALESERARAVIVGEDLGTVEPEARAKLARLAVLSYRLLWFEPDPPAAYPRLALAAVTTHDNPTVAGLWSGADLRTQERLGLAPNAAGIRAIRSRLAGWAGLDEAAPLEEVAVATHRLLAEAPSAIVTATLEDALLVEERPNVPATTPPQWPNWSLALPRPLEELERAPLARAIAGALARRRRRRARAGTIPPGDAGSG